MSALPHDERLIDLLCEHAARGLEPSARAELDRALPDATLLDDFDRAAAALAVALLPDAEPMPAGLRRSLAEAAPAAPPALRLAADDRAAPGVITRRFGALGWLAAAASLAFAMVLWSSRPRPAAEPTLAERYAALAAEPGVVRAAWAGLDDLKLTPGPHRFDDGLAGEVIWDARSQSGFMKFTGLAANDPRELQYQLWIFDATRPTGDLPHFAIEGFPELLTQRPVDGGVFDASYQTEGGELIVPIDAKLFVGQAAIFAITVEPPGGVVVSDRDIVTAAIAG